MRRSVLLVGGAACAIVFGAVAPAEAKSPEPTPFSINDPTDTDPDFCGTGEAVDITFSAKGVDFLSPNGGLEFASVGHGTVTYTYGENTVIQHFAGLFTDEIVSGDPEGVHVHAFTNVGLPEQFRLQGGGVITLDAGTITFFVRFNGDEFVSDEGFTFNGPHPQAESDFTLFCDVMPEALGIT